MTITRTLSTAALVALMAAAPALAGGKQCADAKAAHAMKHCTMSAQECLEQMATHFKTKGWVGLELEVEDSGAMSVSKVIPESPAVAAGFQIGDVLVALNGAAFSEKDSESLKKAKEDMKPGHTVTYTVARDGRDVKLDVTLGKAPDQVLAQWVGSHMMEHTKTAELASK